jgi:hypothetical protein
VVASGSKNRQAGEAQVAFGLGVHFALRSDDNVEVGILGGDVVFRRAG